jgi:hypothetical protein
MTQYILRINLKDETKCDGCPCFCAALENCDCNFCSVECEDIADDKTRPDWCLLKEISHETDNGVVFL